MRISYYGLKYLLAAGANNSPVSFGTIGIGENRTSAEYWVVGLPMVSMGPGSNRYSRMA